MIINFNAKLFSASNDIMWMFLFSLIDIFQMSKNRPKIRSEYILQGAFHALRPEDLRRRPDFFAGVAASFFQ